jgi:serine protease Do
VEPGTPAHRAGIEPGDILISIDDIRITDMDTLNSVIFRHEVGDVVTVVIYRSGQKATVELRLTEDKG